MKMKKAAHKKKAATSKDVLVTLKRIPAKDALPAQALAILEALKAKGGKMTAQELKKAMESRVTSVQTMSRLWVFYRARLVEQGTITLGKGEAR